MDLTVHLAGDMAAFASAAAKTAAEKDIATAAKVSQATVTLLAVQPGSVVLTVAIEVASPAAGQEVTRALGREMSFGRLKVGGQVVVTLGMNVIGARTRVPAWRVASEVMSALVVLGFIGIPLLPLLLFCTCLHTNSTRTERIASLKTEIVERELRDRLRKKEEAAIASDLEHGAWVHTRDDGHEEGMVGAFASVVPTSTSRSKPNKQHPHSQLIGVGHAVDDYVEFDVRHLLRAIPLASKKDYA